VARRLLPVLAFQLVFMVLWAVRVIAVSSKKERDGSIRQWRRDCLVFLVCGTIPLAIVAVLV
jgi:hypothetical protein